MVGKNMQKYQKQKIILTILTLILINLIILSPLISAEGFAISPSEIKLENGLKGGVFKKQIRIINTNNYELNVNLSIDGSIKDWITFKDNESNSITSIYIPANDYNDIIINIDIPEDAANEEYNSTIYASTTPETGDDESGTSTTVLLKIQADIYVDVTGVQILTGKVHSISANDIEINYPFRIMIDFQNTGNVNAYPEIYLNIVKDNAIIYSNVYSDEYFKVNEQEIIQIEWNSTNNDPGEYIANITVKLDDEIIEFKSIEFNIFKEGTLTRNGTLIKITPTGLPLVNRFLKISGEFENTGEIDTYAQFFIEVYRDDDLILINKSDIFTLIPGEILSIPCYFEIEESGEYQVLGYVNYQGKLSETKELNFTVEPAVSDDDTTDTPFPNSIFIIIVTNILLNNDSI
jgi:hypothetical protein